MSDGVTTGRPQPYTIADAERLLPQAKKVAEHMGIPWNEAPLYLGVLSTEPISEADLARARQFALDRGWIKEPEQPTRGVTVETKEKVLITLDESIAEWLYDLMASRPLSDDYARKVWTALRDALFGESDA